MANGFENNSTVMAATLLVVLIYIKTFIYLIFKNILMYFFNKCKHLSALAEHNFWKKSSKYLS